MSARLKLTLSYAGFLVVAGFALVALLVYILRFVPEGNLSIPTAEPDGSPGRPGRFVPDRGDLLTALWPKAWMVLGALAVVGLAGGWFLAGRMLRPLQRIHRVTQQVAAGSLDHRVRMAGPRDEFRELADTLDTMLDRLQASLDEHRRFAANASHELRTPYAVERSMLDVALADPAGVDVPELLHRLDRTNRRGTETVEALLALAALDQGRTPPRTPVDLAEITAAVVAELAPVAGDAGIAVRTELGEGDLDGSESLVRQLVVNLVLNGIRHNTGPGGSVTVVTGTADGGRAQLRVTNTGPYVPEHLLGTLTEPFVRGAGRVTAGSESIGSGLGLAIVARVAEDHGADLELSAPLSGGLQVTVTFPSP
ncbi:HAMP domain-containing sensor histidine kinase [Blastococcus sp. TF02A-26]|uniref:sensor histidine kinase n=1 Tax=Blastococcus sp. TF02A-26 TaxID=2250577 RepID=UPI000DEA1CAC|nr:HAMP domain-containing sensor histidine kinase [Blastococcus sp. TF02A-26]RBY88770.1 two-component sensor histidine kinase [Blastococcus sp. TF02A-26]